MAASVTRIGSAIRPPTHREAITRMRLSLLALGSELARIYVLEAGDRAEALLGFQTRLASLNVTVEALRLAALREQSETEAQSPTTR